MKKTAIAFAAMFLLVCGFQVGASAQGEEIDAEKTALIKEMFDLMEMDKMFDQMTTMMVGNMKSQIPTMMKNAAGGLGDSMPDDKKSILINEIMPEYMEKALTRAMKALNINKMVEEVYVPLYAKYFSIEEIMAINDFYKTPAGRKTIEAAPAITAEAMNKIMSSFIPDMVKEMNALNKEFADELRTRLELDDEAYKALLKKLNVE
ncbi:MAG TPA: DUF2059 domain-containing protein [bacterium]|nr:DUF2059 domain-containing protein [bacterium]